MGAGVWGKAVKIAAAQAKPSTARRSKVVRMNKKRKIRISAS
jgi:hypothetical protein